MTKPVAKPLDRTHRAAPGGAPSADAVPPRRLPQLGRDGRILEGVATTLGADARLHLAPMGPIVGKRFDRLIFRPYNTSTTYANLRRERCGVFHVVDDALLIARSAIGVCDPPPPTRPASAVHGAILSDACQWFAFRVSSIDDSCERSEIVAEVVDQGEQRPFFGFNRAKHAVLEAAILASRVGMLPADVLQVELLRLQAPVRKTGAAEERLAFHLLVDYLKSRLGEAFNDDAFGEIE